MAFATANVKAQSSGSFKVTVGDWTSSAADDNGTVVVAGGRVYFANFSAQDAVSGELTSVPWTASTSGALTTITVYPHDTVAAGRFIVFHA